MAVKTKDQQDHPQFPFNVHNLELAQRRYRKNKGLVALTVLYNRRTLALIGSAYSIYGQMKQQVIWAMKAQTEAVFGRTAEKYIDILFRGRFKGCRDNYIDVCKSPICFNSQLLSLDF